MINLDSYKKKFYSVKKNIQQCNTEMLGENGTDFYFRMYENEPELYFRKILSLGFENLNHVLDLGCGVGQWSFCMASCNRHVTSVDINLERIKLVNKLRDLSHVDNLDAKVGVGENIPVDDNSVDGIFCFGVLHYLDTNKFLNETYRVLSPGGKLYVTGKDVGGYLYFLEENKGASSDYSPRQCAIDAFINTYFLKRFNKIPDFTNNTDRIISCDEFCALAFEKNFEVVDSGSEGTICLNDKIEPVNFFTTEYKGFPKCYEVILKKK